MRRSVALVFLALAGFTLVSGGSGDEHNHHNRHKHVKSSNSVHEEQSAERYTRPIDFAPQYRQQKEYIYQYDAQISTGLSGQSQNAVQRMRAQLRLTFSGEKSATGQLKQWQSARMNDDTHQPISKMMSFDSLRTTEIPKRHLDLLEKPFEISYEHGKIVEIVFDKEDKVWSENMKRAALNAFQLNMDVEERDSMTYRRNETTIEGECESMYTIIPDIKCNTVKSTESRHLEPKDKGQCVQVTKSVNFELCTKRPDLRYNHFRGEQLDTTSSAHKEQRAIEQSTLGQIELKKDEGKYVLRFARTISHQTVHLTENSALMAVSVGELQLKSVKKPTPNNAEVGQKKSATSLMHSLEFDDLLEQFVINGDETYINQQPYLTERNIADVLVNIGKRMAQSFAVNAKDEWNMNGDSLAHQFVNFVKILRHATQKDLEKAEERLFQKDEEIPSAQQKSAVERLYNDALALAATNPTIRRLLEKIEKKQMSEREASSVLQKLAKNVQIIGKESLNSIFQLCQKTETGSNLKHACVLSWSRMANTMCGRIERQERGMKIGDLWVQDKKDEPRCSESVKDGLVKNAQQLYDSAKDDSEQRILALKAFGNMGLDSSIQKLEQLINDRSLPRLERIIAIDALRHMVTKIPHKIRRVLMSVFVDKREHPEVRMNALHLIMKAQPDQPTISQIGMEALRESNVNVRTFVIEELKSAAISMQKISPKTAQQIRNTLQLFKLSSVEQEEQMRRSGSRFDTVKIDEQLLKFARIYSNDSGLPKELMVQFDFAIREHLMPVYVQFGLHQQNAEQIISKLFDHIGSRSVDEILVRGKRSTLQRMAADPVQTMKQMWEKLKITARRQPNGESQLMFYQREKNMDTWFVLLDEKHMPESIKQLFVDGQMDMNAFEGTHQLKSVDASFIFEAKIKVPTIFGVPVVSSARLTKVSSVHGTVQTELDGQGKYISSGRLVVKTTPRISLKMVQKLEAFSPLFTAGVQLQHNLDGQVPFSMEASFSSQKGLVVDFKLPEHTDRTYKLFSISSHPSTLYREWPQKSRVYIEHEEKTLYLPQLQDTFTQIDKQVNCPLSQVKLDIRGHFHRGSRDQGMYLGENVLEIHAHVNEKTAKVIRFQVRAGSKSASGQSMETQRLMRVFEDKRQQLFKGNTKPEEVRMLQEYMQRHESHASSLFELDTKLMALTSQSDSAPREQVEVLIKGMCDKDMKVCSKEMHVAVKGQQLNSYMGEEEWSAHVVSNIARPTMTGLHGSVRSEHVLVHAEAQFGGKTDKNTLTLCAYGRPSNMQVEHWNEVKNMQSASRRAQSDRFDDMEDSEYDRMVIKQLPSQLNANSYTFLTEHQLNSKTMKIARPYLQYVILATKQQKPAEMLLWAFEKKDESAEDSLDRLHGQMKADFTVEAGIVNFRMNDMSHSQRLPSWVNRRSMSGTNEEDTQYHQQLFNNRNNDAEQQESGNENQRKNGENKENELPSRHSFGQRQAMRRFGADSQSENNAKCVMDSQFNIESFDGKKYKIPMSTCYTVLAKDCSSPSAPKFAVLAKKQSESNSDLKIKLLIPKKQFELFEEREGKMVIKADGVQLREDEYEQNGIHKITETRRPTYVLHCSVTGMELRFDGRTTMLSISNEYINKQCGVCGHYNLDSEDTLRKEDNTLASNLKEFHSSYLYRGEDNNEECTEAAQKQFDEMKVDEYNKQSRSEESSSESDDLVEEMEKKNQNMSKHVHNAGRSQEEQRQSVENMEKKLNKGKKHRKNGGQKKQQKSDGSNYELESNQDESKEFDREFKKIDPVLMTVVVEEQDIICFSIKPHMSCPRGSYAVVQDWQQRQSSTEDSSKQQQGTDVEFICKPRSNSSAHKWNKKAQSHNVVEELKSIESNKQMPVPQVKRCNKASPKRMSADY